jgi:hypothetical protein
MVLPKQQLLFLELNEINFKFIEAYIGRGALPNFKRFFERHGYAETVSETKYDDLEPWIQWVSAHTGKSLAEHGVFRLGDIVDHDHPQIWERLEDQGLRVGAISPMNAKFRLRQPAFFVPDPWTPTDIIAPPHLQRMFRAIVQAVNDNAEARLSPSSVFDLALGALSVARPANYPRYLRYAASARRKPWLRAVFLDLLLADLFSDCVAKTKPDFATLFLNAGAHIQHHYMFSSPVYKGALRNPEWYLPPGVDPLLDVYELYDAILGDIQRLFPRARLMLATGLHQDPHPELTYYWRLRDHGAFLRKIGVEFQSVEPRMSRDFLVRCADEAEAQVAERRLAEARTIAGDPLFDVDNRGDDLFVMLIYPNDIPTNLRFRIGNEEYSGLRTDVAFVAIKNGRHNGTGYFADSAVQSGFSGPSMQLTDLPDRVMTALAA